MTYRSDETTMGPNFLGFQIQERDGWYVGICLSAPEQSRVFEAPSLTVLEHKIRRFWVQRH
jgi:hypothetical protein